MCLQYGMEEAAKHPMPARQGGLRALDYRIVAAWSGFLLFVGAGAFVVDMAIHTEATAKPPAPPEPIYYCATGDEFPAFEPSKELKDQRDI